MPLSVEAAHVLLVSSCGAYRLQSKVERMKHNMEVERSTFDTARCDMVSLPRASGTTTLNDRHASLV
jgi:hypothetical protein